MMTVYTLLLLASVIISVNAINVNSPSDVLINGNCSGPLDVFLCNCLTSNITIDIHLSPGQYNFSKQPECSLRNKTSIEITGSSDNGTVIRCIDGFSVMFILAQNIVIRNLVMLGCGGVAVNKYGVQKLLGQYVFYFDDATNVTVTNLYMTNTRGYSIVISQTNVGSVEFSDIHITNTAAINKIDKTCTKYDYNSKSADFSCSGSGILILYQRGLRLNADMGSANSKLTINNCLFLSNTNTLPKTKYDEFLGVTSTRYKGNPIPIVGAASISIFYAQGSYTVATTISNTRFYNNSGTLSASIAVIAVHSTKSRTLIENCTFYNSNQSVSDNDVSGIYFINLGTLSTTRSTDAVIAEVLTVRRSEFLYLVGKMGVAFRIEKNSPDSVLVVVKVEECNFTRNKADSGSAIFARDRSSSLSYRQVLDGSLIIHLVDVNAEYNVISPLSTIEIDSSNFITGVFHVSNTLVLLTCNSGCHFQHNQPSVLYGHNSAITISGNVTFMNNTARYGGAVRLVDTVLYIKTHTTIHFVDNFAVVNGGAIKVEFPVTDIQAQDICPFQFVGLPIENTITDNNFTNIDEIMDIDVLFQSNYARTKTNSGSDLESISANVFYVCSWYPDTSVQTQLGPDSEIVNITGRGYRNAVYREAFNYVGDSIHNHLNISAIVPCVCNDANDFSQHVVDCLETRPFNLSNKVIPGRPFVIRVTALDTVGSVGDSEELISTAYNTSSLVKFMLNDEQVTREFSVGNRVCVEVDFTIYVHTNNESLLNATTGILTLSVATIRSINMNFNFVDKCPTGFVLDGTDQHHACMCNTFLTEVSSSGFTCDQRSGLIKRVTNKSSWLAADNGDIQFVEQCSPTLCDNMVDVSLNLSVVSNADVLCANNHAGRACGDCKNNFSRVFGSDSCKKCSNVWLVTVLLYALLGIVLVVILFLLKFTVTQGVINGLIFFCNIMSINDKLFFNTNISKFSFLRMFISLFNLDLGFEICFYHEMSQAAKTGFQFIFPVYLWPLILVIVYLSRWSHRFHVRVSHSAVPVFATLILLSYAKLLRTAISVFSFVEIESSMTGSIRAWRPDPSVDYWEPGHAVLFIIAILFLLFIIPFAICFTYPKLLHSKKLSYFFPLFDSFVAPYKDKYRYWFGVRALILIYLAMMETIIFADTEALLLSSISVVGAFALVQAYIRPFKSKFTNILDLAFTSIFLLLSSIVLYINPTSNGYKNSNLAVYSLGYVAFILFWVVIVYHIHHVSKGHSWYINTLQRFWKKLEIYKEKDFIKYVVSAETIRSNLTSMYRFHNEYADIPKEEKFQESFYEEM